MFNRAVSRLSRKRPPSEINDSEGHPSSSHQTLKGTSKWATSLENLLEDPEGVKRFREFLKKEFSEENVLFWLACEEFKKTQGKKQMQEKAKEIYMTFLSSKASSQVNVEGQSRLNETILETPHPLMFQKLQDQLSRNYLETPAFNPLFQDLEREKSSSSQLDRALSVRGLGGSPRRYLKGHPTTSSTFHDKPLQEYFNERLMELRNYESKRSNRKTKGFADKNQKAFLTRRGSRRRSSAGVVTGLSKETQTSCSSANQDNKNAIEYNNEEETQNVLGPYKADFLDILTMHIFAPLEAFVQKK
ncbi:regulator of G-protein signaling 10 isoform 1-T1 [Porphyrio hochstetteri]